MNLWLALILLALLCACSTMRQRTVVVSVYDSYPIAMDSVKVSADSVAHIRYQREVKKQEGKKNFWKGATAVLVVIILLEIATR